MLQNITKTLHKGEDIIELMNITTTMKFDLEEFLIEHAKNLKMQEDGHYQSTREVERLVSQGKLERAFDLYSADGYADLPLDYDEFVASMITTQSNLD